jgi:hypothetical protein
VSEKIVAGEAVSETAPQDAEVGEPLSEMRFGMLDPGAEMLNRPVTLMSPGMLMDPSMKVNERFGVYVTKTWQMAPAPSIPPQLSVSENSALFVKEMTPVGSNLMETAAAVEP